MNATVEALRVCVNAPVSSFRDPLYPGIQTALPCPPPSTVAGLLAAVAGGWSMMDEDTRFAMAFHAAGGGVDVETYHPLDADGANAAPTPRDRAFLAGVSLTVWLLDGLAGWERAFRRPVWPVRLGRSQDLASVRTYRTVLNRGDGGQRQAVVPAADSSAGLLLRLPTAVSLSRDRTRWDAYRYRTGDAPGPDHLITDTWVDQTGQAVVLLPPCHPVHAGQR